MPGGMSWDHLFLYGHCTESLESVAGLWHEADGEVRIEIESAFEECDRLLCLAPSGGDHPGVEAHQRVLGAETKSLLAGLGRAVQVAATVERPGEGVPGDDARAHVDLRSGSFHRPRQVFGPAVVRVEEGQLEIGVDAVRRVE